MVYCTKADLEAAFTAPKIAAWSRNDDAVITAAIKSAEGEIDGYLISGGYTTPRIPVPEIIKKYAVDMAVFNILTAKGFQDSEGDRKIGERNDNALAFLRGVGAGKYRIPEPDTDEEPEAARPRRDTVKVSAPARLDLSRYR